MGHSCRGVSWGLPCMLFVSVRCHFVRLAIAPTEGSGSWLVGVTCGVAFSPLLFHFRPAGPWLPCVNVSVWGSLALSSRWPFALARGLCVRKRALLGSRP